VTESTNTDGQELILAAPDDGGWHHTVMRDWIAVCPDIGPTAFRLYVITRSLVIEKRGAVRKLTLMELCQLLPGPNGKPSSVGRIRDAIRELSAVGLYTTPDGQPVTTSSSKRATERPLLIRINDFPSNPGAYGGPRNAFAVLESIRGGNEEAPGWKSNQGQGAGWKSNQVGQKSNQSGCDSNHETALTSGNAAPKEDFEGRLGNEDAGGDARRASTGSREASGGGSAASDKMNPPSQKPKPASIRTVVEAIPAPLARLLEKDWPRGLPGEVTDLIEKGLTGEQRTAQQLADRIGRRWTAFGYEDAALSATSSGVRAPVGVLLELLSPSKCWGNNLDCEDGVDRTTDASCPRCEEAREDRIRVAEPASAPEPPREPPTFTRPPAPLPTPRADIPDTQTYGVNTSLARQAREAVLANKGRVPR
jgi:hypothetical protein